MAPLLTPVTVSAKCLSATSVEEDSPWEEVEEEEEEEEEEKEEGEV
jgi:hypothetical protein